MPIPALSARSLRITYLSDSIELDRTKLPELAEIRELTGGIYLTLHGTPIDADLDEALAVRRALGFPNA